jgi:hypothetical protein
MTTLNAFLGADVSELEQARSDYSDFHKEAFGFRPRWDYSAMTLADFDREFEYLAQECKRNAELRAEAEAEAADLLERRVLSLLECGAKSRAMALRWIAEAEEVNGDVDYLCFILGVKYGYITQADLLES